MGSHYVQENLLLLVKLRWLRGKNGGLKKVLPSCCGFTYVKRFLLVDFVKRALRLGGYGRNIEMNETTTSIKS